MRAPDWLTARPVAHRGLHVRISGIIENMPGAAAAAIAGEHLRHPPHQFAVAVKMAFDLDHQSHPACDQRAEIAERHHLLGGVLEFHRLELA